MSDDNETNGIVWYDTKNTIDIDNVSSSDQIDSVITPINEQNNLKG